MSDGTPQEKIELLEITLQQAIEDGDEWHKESDERGELVNKQAVEIERLQARIKELENPKPRIEEPFRLVDDVEEVRGE